MGTNQPLVSIYCLTYNHEKYIRDCLDGFIMQKTDFPFEVIVHDDASKDNTQSIIREYAEKYPDIIKPIFQAVNQYQKRNPIVSEYIFPRVQGKYVGICEGDDYWIDPDKLSKQTMMLESYPECHLCVCGVEEVSLNKTPLGYCHPNVEIDHEIIHPEEFIGYAGSYSFQTSSYLMRYDDWKKYILNPPEFKKGSDMGDITMLLYFGSLGDTAYINKVMSCYRRGAPESFSANRANWTEKKRVQHYEKQLKVWKQFDDFSEKKFHKVCIRKLSDMLFGYYILQCKGSELLKAENKEYFTLYRIPKKAYVILSCCFKEKMKKNYLATMQKREQAQYIRWRNL